MTANQKPLQSYMLYYICYMLNIAPDKSPPHIMNAKTKTNTETNKN